MNRFKHLIKAAAAIVLTYVLCASALLQPMAVYAATPQTQQPAAESADASSTQDSSAGDVSDDTANEVSKDADSADAAQDKATPADAADEDEAANEGDAAAPESLDAEGEQAADGTVIGDSEANSWRYQNGELRSDLRDDNATDLGVDSRSMHEMPEGATLQGIDVSGYQKNIDWQKVKDAGIDFAILKIGNINAHEPDGWYTDSRFQRNLSECERLGIPYGVYAYSYAKNADDAVKGANHIIALLKGHKPTLPVYLDLEDNSIKDTDHAAIATAFCNTISAAGYTPGIYASASWFKNILTGPCFSNNGWSTWTAQYWYGQRYDASLGLGPEYPAKFDCWQYSVLSTVPGIDGHCDINYWYKNGFSSPNGKAYSFTGIKLSKSEGVLKGDTVSVSAEVTGETDGLQYKFYWQKEGTGADAGTSGVIAGPSEESSAEWTVDGSGTYKISCDVIDSKGSVTKSATCTVERFTVDGLEAPSSARCGQGVSLKAKVSGDASGLKYKFVWQKDNWKKWGVVGGSSQDEPEATWTPDEPGDYTVTLDVIDGSRAKHATARIEVAERFTVDGLEAPSSARCGQGVSLKAKVSGDASGLKYKFVWQKDNWKKWGVVGGSSQDEPEATWTPDEPGDYTVTLDVIDGSRAKHATARIEVYKKYLIKGISLETEDGDVATVGSNCTIKVESEGDTSGLKYKFVWEKNNWSQWGSLRQFDSSNKCGWTPEVSGDVNIWVDIQDSNGTITTVHYPVSIQKESFTYCSLSCNSSLIELGNTIGVKADASGNTNYLMYRFVWSRDNWAEWGVAQSSRNNTMLWTPSKPGDYTIYCDVIASDGSATTKTISFSVFDYLMPTAISTDGNWSWGIRANLGTLAAEKTGQFNFKFVYANADWSKWGVLKSGSSINDAYFNPSSLGLTSGTWNIYVDVQYPDGSWHTKSTSVWVGYRGYQNPAGYYQVSCCSVNIPHLNSGIFGYRTPSRIGTYATRDDCINAMITRAFDYVGTTPYIWDYSCAPGVGVDCAGLVMQCLYATGMDLGRYTPWDHYYTPGHNHYANDMWNDPRFMHASFSQRQRGDLICYQGHIAIYLGNDQIIEASSPRNGVRVHSVYVGLNIKGVLRPLV